MNVKPVIVPEQLLLNLEAQYPNAVPNVGDTDREIWMKVGQQELIRSLRSKYNNQNKKDS